MKAVVGAVNQEKALVGAFSVIVQPVVESMEHYTALIVRCEDVLTMFTIQCWCAGEDGQVQAGAGRAPPHRHPRPHRGQPQVLRGHDPGELDRVI